jgi:CBS-domain-containing membrane protein
MRTYASGQHANAYPLKTFDGAVDGIVTLARLARVPQEERRVRRVRDFGIGMDRVATARPGEPLGGVLDRFSASGDGQMLVMDDGKLVGSLSASDIIRALGGAARSSS